MKNLFTKIKIRNLDKKNAAVLKRAVEAQRNGKLELYGKLIQQSETIISEKKSLEDSIKSK